MKLNYLTDKALLKDTLVLVTQEREILSKILWHLREIENRKLFADLRCGSLFEYCVKILKYSESQAARRVTACRLLKEVPEVSERIEKGELNLTQLNQARNFFNEEQVEGKDEKMEILDKIAGKSTRESEKILWEMKKEDSPKKVLVQLNEETFEKLKELQALKAHSCKNMDELLVKMCDELSEKWRPKSKRSSRQCSETRYIPSQVKAYVWKRDHAKCQNCGSTYAFEFDHIEPFAMGGKTEPENLRLLCRSCNQRRGLTFYAKNQLGPRVG